MNRFIIAGFGALLLAACSATPPAVTALVGIEASESAAITALVVYENTPAGQSAAGHAIEQKVLADVAVLDAGLTPLEQAAEAGNPITPGTAITSALDALIAEETTTGISTPGGT